MIPYLEGKYYQPGASLDGLVDVIQDQETGHYSLSICNPWTNSVAYTKEGLRSLREVQQEIYMWSIGRIDIRYPRNRKQLLALVPVPVE